MLLAMLLVKLMRQVLIGQLGRDYQVNTKSADFTALHLKYLIHKTLTPGA
jgi:hypothetical protein